MVSIIVPVYQVEAYLDKCVGSLLAQTYRDLEIILVDDGSPDCCGAICDGWAVRDSRVKVVHKENGGLSDARNAGLAVATGDVIGFVDSDDWIEADFVELLLKAMDDSGAEVAECAIRLVAEDGTVLRRRGPAQNEAVDKLEALSRLIQEKGVYQTVWNKLYRRQIIEGILFEKGKCNEDDFWTYQVFDRISKLALVEKPLLNYLQRGGSIMGVGYSLKRLDGMEARLLRWQRLRRYEQLDHLCRYRFGVDCLWHLQKARRELSGPERKIATERILGLLEQVPKTKLKLPLRKRVWYELFLAMPKTTVKVRNLLKIGL